MHALQLDSADVSIEALRDKTVARRLKRASRGLPQHFSRSGDIEGGMRSLQRQKSLSLDYYKFHSRPPPLIPIAAGSSSEDVPGLLPQSSDSPSGERDLKRVNWSIGYEFAYDPLLDGPDVMPGSQDCAPAGSSRNVLIAYAALLRQFTSETDDSDDDDAAGQFAAHDRQSRATSACAASATPLVASSPSQLSLTDGTNSVTALSAFFSASATSRSIVLSQFTNAALQLRVELTENDTRPVDQCIDRSTLAATSPEAKSIHTPLPAGGHATTSAGLLRRQAKIETSQQLQGPLLPCALADAPISSLSPSLSASLAVESRILRHIKATAAVHASSTPVLPRSLPLAAAQSSPVLPEACIASSPPRIAVEVASNDEAVAPHNKEADSYFKTGPFGVTVRVPLPANPPRLDPLSRRRNADDPKRHATATVVQMAFVDGSIAYPQTKTIALKPVQVLSHPSHGGMERASLSSSETTDGTGTEVAPTMTIRYQHPVTSSADSPAHDGATSATLLSLSILQKLSPPLSSPQPVSSHSSESGRKKKTKAPAHARKLLDAVLFRKP
jgi:hypothetical protein